MNLRVPLKFGLALILFTACAILAPAQEADVDCAATDVETSYEFLSTATGQQVAVNFQNISQRSCRLWSGAGLSFADAHHGHSIWTEDCRNCSEDGKARQGKALDLRPQSYAHLLGSWSNKALGDSKCQEGGDIAGAINQDVQHQYRVSSGELLGDVCSVVFTDSYMAGRFPEEGAHPRLQSSVQIKLSPSGEHIYARDSFWLNAEVLDSGGMLPLNAQSCPDLFLHIRSSKGSDTLLELHQPCVRSAQGSFQFQISTRGWVALGATDLIQVELLALAGSAQAARVEMVKSNRVSLNVRDTESIPRSWGPEVRGLAVSLVLDKENYVLGEDIPLRLPWRTSRLMELWRVENCRVSRD
jgi:hypothetical protein